MKGCVRWEARRQVSILNLRLNRDRVFLHPIKENIKPTLVDVNGLIAKTIVYHQLSAAEPDTNICATQYINHELARLKYHPRKPLELRQFDSTLPCSGDIR